MVAMHVLSNIAVGLRPRRRAVQWRGWWPVRQGICTPTLNAHAMLEFRRR